MDTEEVPNEMVGIHPQTVKKTLSLIQEQMTEHSDLMELREMQEWEEKGQINLSEEQRTQEECYLLTELARIEQNIREKSRKELQRQEALERQRKEENQERWRSLCYMTLSQRINKPWVFSFFKNVPMHIYCQPIKKPPQVRYRRKWR